MFRDFIAFINKLDRGYRLLISICVGILMFLLSEKHFSVPIIFMMVWISFSLPLLAFSWITILTSHPKEVRLTAAKQDETKTFTFLFIVTAAIISLFAIILLLRTIPGASYKGLSFHILLSTASVVCSWTLVHTIFTLRYAHLYYIGEDPVHPVIGLKPGGLNFPDGAEPDYLDFAYFSFGIGMTFQVSDVQITSRQIRRLSLLHALLSFIYNTVIVALSINIIAGIIQK